jgi:hypothetical protein
LEFGYVAEADCKLRQNTDEEFRTTYPQLVWHVEKHWAGQGGFAHILIIKHEFKQQVIWTSWEERAVGILLSLGTRGRQRDQASQLHPRHRPAC